MARELGTFEFPSNFEVKKAGPIDARGLVTELTDLTSIPFQYYGQIVRVENVGLFYCSNPGSANVEDWLPVGSGGALEAIEGTSDINSIIIKDKREARHGWDYDNNGATAIESSQGIIDLSFASGSALDSDEGVNYRSTFDSNLDNSFYWGMTWEGVPEKIIAIGPATKVSAKEYTLALGMELGVNGNKTIAVDSQITQDPIIYPQFGEDRYFETGGNSIFGRDIVVEGGVNNIILGNNISAKGHNQSIIIGNTVLADRSFATSNFGVFSSSEVIIIGNDNEDPIASKYTVIGHNNSFESDDIFAFHTDGTLIGNNNQTLSSSTVEENNVIGHGNIIWGNIPIIVGNTNTVFNNRVSVLGSYNEICFDNESRTLVLGDHNGYNKELGTDWVNTSIGEGRDMDEVLTNENPDEFDFFNAYTYYGQWIVPSYVESLDFWRFRNEHPTEYNNAVNNYGFQALSGYYWTTTRGSGSLADKLMIPNASGAAVNSKTFLNPSSNSKARLIYKVHPSEFEMYGVQGVSVGSLISVAGQNVGVVIKVPDDTGSTYLGKGDFVVVAAMSDYVPAANQFWQGNETTYPFFADDPVRPIATGSSGAETANGAPIVTESSNYSGDLQSKAWYEVRPSVFFWDIYNGDNGKVRIPYNSNVIIPTTQLEILKTGEVLAPNYLKTSQYADRGDKLMTQENVLDLKSGYEVTAAFKDQPSEIYVEPFTPIAYNRMGKISVPALDPSNYPATGTVELGNSNYSNLLNWVEESGSNARAVVESGIKTVDGIAGFQTLVDSTTTSVAARGVIVVDGTTTSGSYDIASDTINQLDIFVAKTDDFQYFGMRYHANGTRPWVAFSTHKDSSANELVETSPGAQDVHFGDLANVASGAVGIYDIRMFGSVSTPNGYNRIQKIDYSDNIWLFRVTFTGIVGEGNASPSRIELAPAITRQSAWENPNSGQTSLATGQVDVFGISLVTSDAPGQEVPQLAYYNEIDYIGFSLDPGLRSTRNAPYWGEFEGPNGHTLDDFDGLFAGEYMPGGVDKLFNYDHLWINSVAASGYSVPTTISSAVRQLLDPVGELCKGSIRLDQCRRGDRLEVRFDFYIRVTEACSVDVCLWYQNRNAQDEVTFDFELASTSLKFGAEDVGKTKLQRVPLTAWIATDQDLNAIALPAIKVSAPCYIRPATMKVHIER